MYVCMYVRTYVRTYAACFLAPGILNRSKRVVHTISGASGLRQSGFSNLGKGTFVLG